MVRWAIVSFFLGTSPFTFKYLPTVLAVIPTYIHRSVFLITESFRPRKALFTLLLFNITISIVHSVANSCRLRCGRSGTKLGYLHENKNSQKCSSAIFSRRNNRITKSVTNNSTIVSLNSRDRRWLNGSQLRVKCTWKNHIATRIFSLRNDLVKGAQNGNELQVEHNVTRENRAQLQEDQFARHLRNSASFWP